jgi:3-hydroxyacyl-CoA dehydrogenase
MDLEDINTVAVLGAGNMGHGIAEVAAIAGYNVNMRISKTSSSRTATTRSSGHWASSPRTINSPKKNLTPPSSE